jgi:hypothetical protein
LECSCRRWNQQERPKGRRDAKCINKSEAATDGAIRSQAGPLKQQGTELVPLYRFVLRASTICRCCGSGRQLAILRTHSRACALSVMPGNSWRSSTAAENFAALLVGGADRGSLRFGDDEHRQSMDGVGSQRQAPSTPVLIAKLRIGAELPRSDDPRGLTRSPILAAADSVNIGRFPHLIRPRCIVIARASR